MNDQTGSADSQPTDAYAYPAQPGPAPDSWAVAARLALARRRRTRWRLVVVACVAAGLGAGLFIWAPWEQVPVPPAAVHVQSPTATSVLVSWPASKGGATIDRYLIMRDGRQVGSVPASQTSFTDTGLAPGASYRYTVVAAHGSQRSSPSVKAGATTITPSPVGLTPGQPTWTTVAFRWSASPLGPVPDKYLIYDTNGFVATLPGSTDSYSVTGLSPGTSYSYQVKAMWAGRVSGPSAAVQLSTLQLPLQGDAPVTVKTVSTPGAGASLSVGQTWSDSWTFSSDCTGNQCSLKVDGQFAAPGFKTQPFTMTMTASGGGYSGTTKASVTSCGSVSNFQDTVTMHVAADNGAVDNGAWNSWNGTLNLESPYVTASSTTFCPAQGWRFTLAGSHP